MADRRYATNSNFDSQLRRRTSSASNALTDCLLRDFFAVLNWFPAERRVCISPGRFITGPVWFSLHWRPQHGAGPPPRFPAGNAGKATVNRLVNLPSLIMAFNMGPVIFFTADAIYAYTLLAVVRCLSVFHARVLCQNG